MSLLCWPSARLLDLLPVCVTTFINALKEIANAVLGTYANLALWKLIVFALNLGPLLIVSPSASAAAPFPSINLSYLSAAPI